MRRIFRGKDLGSVGGDLFLTDRCLLAVSNRTISAYPRAGHRRQREVHRIAPTAPICIHTHERVTT